MSILSVPLHGRGHFGEAYPRLWEAWRAGGVLPLPGSNILQFTNIANQMKVPFAIFADFESFLEKGEIDAGKTTKLIDTHILSGFCCLTVSSFPEYNNEEPWVCSDGDIMDSFFSYLNLEHVRINNILSKDMPMTPLNDEQMAK